MRVSEKLFRTRTSLGRCVSVADEQDQNSKKAKPITKTLNNTRNLNHLRAAYGTGACSLANLASIIVSIVDELNVLFLGARADLNPLQGRVASSYGRISSCTMNVESHSSDTVTTDSGLLFWPHRILTFAVLKN